MAPAGSNGTEISIFCQHGLSTTGEIVCVNPYFIATIDARGA